MSTGKQAVELQSCSTVVYDEPHYKVIVKHSEEKGGMVAITVSSVWPKCRNPANAVPHKMLQLQLPKEAMDKLGNAILGK